MLIFGYVQSIQISSKTCKIIEYFEFYFFQNLEGQYSLKRRNFKDF